MENHSRSKNYYEYLAKYILEEFLPQDFCNLTISDRPDIKQSDKTGIEVTRTFIANQAYAEGIFEQIKNKQLGEISTVKISKLGRLGYRVLENKGVVAGICPREAFWVNIEPLKKAFSEKLRKLRDYQTDKTYLFIHAPMFDLYDDADIRDFAAWAAELQKDYSYQYSKVFVYQVTHLSICSLQEKQVTTMKLDQSKVHWCCEQAEAKA